MQGHDERNKRVKRYPALIDGEQGAYGVVFPDLDGVVAMGETIDEALVNAEEALRDHVREARADKLPLAEPTAPERIAVPANSILTMVSLIEPSGKPVRANMLLDEDVLAFIDTEARRRAMTRTAYVSWMTRRIAQMGG